MKITAIPAIPITSPRAAPGQCIILKRKPNSVKLEKNAPEINVILFICNKFNFFLLIWLFRFRPVYLSGC